MTMENTVLEEDKANNNVKTKKRSFDVAFLMTPDDKHKIPQQFEKSAFKKISNTTTTYPFVTSASYQHLPQLPHTSQLPQPSQSSYYSMLLKQNEYLRQDLVFQQPKYPNNNDSLYLTNPLLQTLVLPPSLAALTIPTAQNICAKCNISFRMTSDLVYHMRSHHKNDSSNLFSDPCTSSSAKRRREVKLKCPVCSELFRERHHLTRHMTAHQDKEGDDIIVQKKGSIQQANYGNAYH